jgi:hypothetical protein
MGICMTQLPCRETATERAFSHLKAILSKTKPHMLNHFLGGPLFLGTNERTLEMITLTAVRGALEWMSCAEHVATFQDEENLGQPELREETHPAAVFHWGADASDLGIRGQLPKNTQEMASTARTLTSYWP